MLSKKLRNLTKYLDTNFRTPIINWTFNSCDIITLNNFFGPPIHTWNLTLVLNQKRMEHAVYKIKLTALTWILACVSSSPCSFWNFTLYTPASDGIELKMGVKYVFLEAC